MHGITRSEYNDLRFKLAIGTLLPEQYRAIIEILLAKIDIEPDPYDPAKCDLDCAKCGHSYERHFDGYDDNRPVGCKYCSCREFVESK